MSPLQIVALVVCLVVTAVAIALLVKTVRQFLSVFRLGQTDATRTDSPGQRTTTLLREFLGHTRMSRLPVVAVAHWFTMISFGVLFFTLVNAFGQLVDPEFALPLIGHFFLYEWITDFFAFAGFFSILALMAIRQKNHPRSAAGIDGRRSRFFGSTFWQAYYVELTILGVTICIGLLRAFEWTLARQLGTGQDTALHFPLTGWIGNFFTGLSTDTVENLIVIVAAVKILISFAWMITIALQPTMGVAWHRFLAFFNIWFKRHADGRTSLGELQPLMVDGAPIDFENIEELDEDAALGVGKVEDFTWKGLLDFTTCTECGRCQSQCPAWNTDKPLSPKMLVMTLRDHAHAKAPWLLAAEGERDGLGEDAARLAEVPLIGDTGYDIDHPLTAYNPHGAGAEAPSSTRTSCGRAPPAAPAWSSARSTSSTWTPSSTCAATRTSSSRRSPTSSAACSRTSRTRATRGAWPPAPASTGPRTCRSRSRSSARTSSRPTTSTTCSGSAAPGPTRTGPRRRPGPWPSCSTRPASRSRSSATARRARATRPAARATSSSSRCSPSRTSRSSTRPAPRRSW